MRNKNIDKERILSKLGELDSYIDEVEKIRVSDFEEYKNSIEKKRSCERLLQISIECIIDICNILVSNLKLGIPYDEDSLFEKLKDERILSERVFLLLKEVKGFRNILVHKYSKVEDERVFENLDKLQDFETFKEEILKFMKKRSGAKS